MKNLFNNKMFYSFSALFAKYFPTFGSAEFTMHSEMKRKLLFSFAFLSFFRNFAPPKEKA